MEFRFVAPDLRELDAQSAEVLACCVWSDVRPVRGTAGLVDFRLAGKLSGLSRSDFLTGASGEVVFLPGRPKLPFERMLFFGLGERRALTDADYDAAVRHISKVLEGLQAPRAVVELPGRADARLGPEHAAERLAAAVPENVHDVWWLVEKTEAQRVMAAKLLLERRGTRRG